MAKSVAKLKPATEARSYVLPSAVKAMEMAKQLEQLIPAIQDEVRQAEGREVIEFARAFVVLKVLRDKYDAVLKPLGDTFEDVKVTRLPAKLEEAGINPPTLNIDGSYRVSVSHTLRASIREGMKDYAYDWLRKHKLGDLITSTVNASTLSGAARTMLEENRELEPAFFNVVNMPNTSVTTIKGKK